MVSPELSSSSVANLLIALAARPLWTTCAEQFSMAEPSVFVMILSESGYALFTFCSRPALLTLIAAIFPVLISGRPQRQQAGSEVDNFRCNAPTSTIFRAEFVAVVVFLRQYSLVFFGIVS